MYLVYDDESDLVEILMNYLYYAGVPVVGTSDKDLFMEAVKANHESLKGVMFDLSFINQEDLSVLKSLDIPAYCVTGGMIPEGFEGLSKPFNPEDIEKLAA
jgi:hypothetical protein